MKLTIVDEELYYKTQGCGSNGSCQGNEYEVYAFYTYGLFKKKTDYLILMGDSLCWCMSNKSVKVTTDLNENWVFVPEFKRYYENEMCSVDYKNLYCYKRMTEDETFFLDIYENNKRATLLLKEKCKLN